jgi:hypothetical protein
MQIDRPARILYHGLMNPQRHERRKKSAEGAITSGVVFTLAFGIAWAVTGEWWFVFPVFFAGVLPAVDGWRRLSREKQLRAREAPELSGEKQVLKTAKEERGVVTPALVALKTSLSIAQAEELLENMAGRGHAVMHVSDQGRVEYEFPEFNLRPEE